MVDSVSFPLQPRDGIADANCHSLRALVAKRDWDEIAEIGKARKSPIGWEVSWRIPGLMWPSIR
jgi:hypothetical protein